MLKKLEGSQLLADKANSSFLPWVRSQIAERSGRICSGTEKQSIITLQGNILGHSLDW